MRWLSVMLLGVASVFAAEPKPGLLAKASDGELTVYFVAPTPSATIADHESIHPQLKPSFKVEWTGLLTITNAGEYEFHGVPSLKIDGRAVVGKKVKLPAGERNLRMEFARNKTEPLRVRLEWESENLPRQPIPSSAFTHEREPRELRESQARDLGRELFENFTCTACHDGAPMPYATGIPVESATKSLPLPSLQPSQGCLSATPEPPAIDFHLSREQREALQLFVQTPDISPAPAIDFARDLRRLDCLRCHDGGFDQLVPAAFEAGLRQHPDSDSLFKKWPADQAIPELIRNFPGSRFAPTAATH